MSLAAQRFRIAIPGFAVRPYTLLFGLAMIGLAVPFATRGFSEWDIVYIPTAKHLLAGEDIYFQAHGYVYPPLQSLLAVPVVALPHVAQRLLWFAVNALALWIALRSAWQLAGGPDLEREKKSWREHLAMGLGLCVGLTYFLNSLMHHQSDVILAALLFTGCEQLKKNRWLVAATLFGIAAAMKCTPLLFAAYFLLRGRVPAAIWLIAVFLGLSLLPDLIHSPPDASTWLAKWWNLFLAPMAAAEHRPGVWASDIIFNQSLVGAVNRWCLTGWALNPNFQTFLIEPRLSPGEMKLCIVALAAILGGISFATLRRTTEVSWHCSLVFCGMLLFSPMSSPAHFGLLIVPAFLLARAALIEKSKMARLILIGMLAAAFASNKDLLGAKLYSIGLWHGSVMAAAILALFGCWIEMLKRDAGRSLREPGNPSRER